MPKFPTKAEKREGYESVGSVAENCFDRGWNACLEEVVRVMRLWNFEEGDVPTEWGPISEDVAKVATALEQQFRIHPPAPKLVSMPIDLGI